jgi:hypothetical protein
MAVSPLAGALNREWRRDYEERLAPAPTSWQFEPSLARFGHVHEVLAFIRRTGAAPGCEEGVLRALARQAEAGDREAAMVLIQYLLPCLVRVAARTGWAARKQRTDELLIAGWEAVRTGVELRGRPVKIAFLRTIEHRAIRQPARVARRNADREVLVDAVAGIDGRVAAGRAGRPLSAEPCAGEAVVALLSEAVRLGAAGDDIRLLGGLSLGRSSVREVAAAEGVTDRTVRYRRTAAIRRVASVLNGETEPGPARADHR